MLMSKRDHVLPAGTKSMTSTKPMTSVNQRLTRRRVLKATGGAAAVTTASGLFGGSPLPLLATGGRGPG
jgi:hypothetical protein